MIATILRTLVAAGLLGLLFYRIPTHDVLEAIRSTKGAPIAGAFLLSLVAECLVAYRLVLIARAHDLALSTPEAIAINLSTRFYALALPGGGAVGTALRIHRLLQGTARHVDVVVSVALDRLSTTAVMCALGAVFWIADSARGDWVPGLVLVIAMLGIAVLYILLACRNSLPRVPRIIAWIERRLPRKFADIAQHAHATRAPLALTVRVWGISLVLHSLATFAVCLLASGMGSGVSWITLFWIRPVALLAAGLPVSIAGLGVREGVFALLLGAHGMAPSSAVALSLLAFIVTVLGMALVGAIFEVRRALAKGGPPVPRAPRPIEEERR